jgi:plasmid stabilization system protein ParE
MRYSVSLLEKAVKDVDEIFHWLAKRSPDGAARWEQELDKALRSLQSNPQRCGFVGERQLRREYRQRFFRTRHGHKYRLVFAIENNEVLIFLSAGPGQRSLRKRDL